MDVDGTNLELDLDSRDSYFVATLTDANIKNDFDFID
jgi:flagellin-specific chaperone FliS